MIRPETEYEEADDPGADEQVKGAGLAARAPVDAPLFDARGKSLRYQWGAFLDLYS